MGSETAKKDLNRRAMAERGRRHLPAEGRESSPAHKTESAARAAEQSFAQDEIGQAINLWLQNQSSDRQADIDSPDGMVQELSRIAQDHNEKTTDRLSAFRQIRELKGLDRLPLVDPTKMTTRELVRAFGEVLEVVKLYQIGFARREMKCPKCGTNYSVI